MQPRCRAFRAKGYPQAPLDAWHTLSLHAYFPRRRSRRIARGVRDWGHKNTKGAECKSAPIAKLPGDKMNITDSVRAFKSVWDWARGLGWIQQGLIASAIAVTSLATGWKQVITFYKWCVESSHARHDKAVLAVMRSAHRDAVESGKISLGQISCFEPPGIAQALHRTPEDVVVSLRRLLTKGKVKRGLGATWCLSRDESFLD